MVLSDEKKTDILKRTKQFITNGGLRQSLYTIFAKVDKEHFTAFLVERTTEGLSIGPEEKKLGIRGTSTTQIVLENAKVPVENLLGTIGKGHKTAFNVLDVGRFKLGVVVTGARSTPLVRGSDTLLSESSSVLPSQASARSKRKIAIKTAAIFASESLVVSPRGDDRQ